jgi:hypothetical protein
MVPYVVYVRVERIRVKTILVLLWGLTSFAMFAERPARDRATRMKIVNDILPSQSAARGLEPSWPRGGIIHVYFRNGNAARRTAVAECANEWSRYGNFLFQFHSEPMPAGVYGILIEFWDFNGNSALNSGTWSNLYPSMRLPFNSPAGCLVTQHEFGHALGMWHEFENPSSVPFLNPNADPYQVLQEAFGWDRQASDYHLLKRVVPPSIAKPFDTASVMGYQSEAFFPDLYKPGIVMDPSSSLTAQDKAYVRQLYPGRTTVTFLPYSFSDDWMTRPEPEVRKTWSHRTFSLNTPASFVVHKDTPDQFVLANPARTNQCSFTPGITGNDQFILARGLAVKSTLVDQRPVMNVTMVSNGGSSDSQVGSYTFYIFLADVVGPGQQITKYQIRVAEFSFNSGEKFTGVFMNKYLDDVLKEQVDNLLSSARGTKAAVSPSPNTHPATQVTPADSTPTTPTNASDASVNQCGEWMEKYRLRPHRSWGTMPPTLMGKWEEADCNHKVCQYMRDKYGVIPYGPKGRLPQELHSVWDTPEIECNKIAK